jgi:putative hemolysin
MQRELSVLALFLAACGGTSSPSPNAGSNVASEDERGSTGVPNPAAEYCEKLGYTLADGTCTFPDGTSCEQWSFWRGQCGQDHSYCNLHGGKVAAEEVDKGTWTAVVAVCHVGDNQCEEDEFWRSGVCE